MSPEIRLSLALFATFVAVILSIVGAWLRRKRIAGREDGLLTTFEETQQSLRSVQAVNLGWVLYCTALFCVWQAVGSSAPAVIAYGWAAAATIYVVVWGTLNIVSAIRRSNLRELIWIWNRFDTSIVVANTMFVTTFIWLIMPYCDEGAQMLIITFTIGYISVTIIVAPQQVWMNRFAIITPMISLIIIYQLSHGRFFFWLSTFLVTFCALAWILCRKLSAEVTVSIEARRAAEVLKRMAEADRDARTRFLASASHDLGQPLQSARLFLDQAFRGTNLEQREAAAGNARNALGSMERLLRQMLDHLRLDSGSVEPKIEKLAIGPLIAHLASQFEPVAAMARVKLVILPSKLNVWADRELAERALGNLLDNALRHADARRVLIGARSQGEFVRCWVIDDGCGIAASEIPALFDEYIQGASNGGRQRGGFGLGLASVRRFAGLMHGETGIEARWRNGSAFFLDLPSGQVLASPRGGDADLPSL